MLINAELFLKIKMQTGHFKLNGSLLTSSGRQAWPPVPVCHSHTVLRNDFNKELGRVLQFCDLDPTAFNSQFPHWASYTTAAELRLSDNQIRTLGCWKSDAFKQYICCKALTFTL